MHDKMNAPLPDDFRGPVRLFPLPNLVLFPDVLQPLHIFEPRYRQLMADALQDDRLIALATLKPGWEDQYYERPPLHRVHCVGRIIKEERLPDGRYNLLLFGLRRAHIVEELPSEKLYRTAQVRLLDDVPIVVPAVERQLREQLEEFIKGRFGATGGQLASFCKILQTEAPLGFLCDLFGFAASIDVEVKQQLLEQLDVEKRVRQLLDHLGSELSINLASDMPRRFPPDFSSN